MNIVAMVLAGGEGTRLYPLTAEHAKPAVPFASGYRLVDFVLSNLVNSRISTIYVLAQYKPESLIRHIDSAWSPWFACGEGTIKVLLPRSNRQLFQGTADAVHHYLDLLQAHSPDVVAVFAADHVAGLHLELPHLHLRHVLERLPRQRWPFPFAPLALTIGRKPRCKAV
jgi:glucose-1-phosphate adenylyltransferase